MSINKQGYMNYDQGYCPDPNAHRKEVICVEPKCPPKKVILECGTNPQDAIFEIDDEQVEACQEFTLNRLVIDTSCFRKPLVKIEFSSLVYFEAETDGDEIEVDLLFELIRICNGAEECLQSWRYLKEYELENTSADLEVEMSEPFTVTYCDRACPDCCTYKMKVKGKDFDGDFEALRVVKPDLSAIAVDACD